MSYKYIPKNKNTKQMIANGFKITKDGFNSDSKIPELDQLVEANILECQEFNLKELQDKAKKEEEELKKAKEEAERLAKEAKLAEENLKKEEQESKEANQNLEKAKTNKNRRKKRNQGNDENQ